jgi:5-methylcytosine-specific restriction endonuclease McrA
MNENCAAICIKNIFELRENLFETYGAYGTLVSEEKIKKCISNFLRFDDKKHLLAKTQCFDFLKYLEGLDEPHCPVCLKTKLTYETCILGHIKPIEFFRNSLYDYFIKQKKIKPDEKNEEYSKNEHILKGVFQEANHWKNLTILCSTCDKQMSNMYLVKWRDFHYPRYKKYYIANRPIHCEPKEIVMEIGKTIKNKSIFLMKKEFFPNGLWISQNNQLVPCFSMKEIMVEHITVEEELIYIKAYQLESHLFLNEDGLPINGKGNISYFPFSSFFIIFPDE